MTASRKIVTNNIYPPIPDRRFDWSATFHNYEPGAPIGYGRTQQEAINDLLLIDDGNKDERVTLLGRLWRNLRRIFQAPHPQEREQW